MCARRKKQEDSAKIDIPDYVFKFKDCKLEVEFEEDYFDKDQQQHIKDIVLSLGKEIIVDKTFVEYKGTKYNNTFIREDGWKELCTIIHDTNLGLKASKEQNFTLLVCYQMLIICYVYQILDDIGIDIDGLQIDLAVNSRFLSHVEEDTYKEWERYPGKWQTWNDSTFKK